MNIRTIKEIEDNFDRDVIALGSTYEASVRTLLDEIARLHVFYSESMDILHEAAVTTERKACADLIETRAKTRHGHDKHNDAGAILART